MNSPATRVAKRIIAIARLIPAFQIIDDGVTVTGVHAYWHITPDKLPPGVTYVAFRMDDAPEPAAFEGRQIKIGVDWTVFATNPIEACDAEWALCRKLMTGDQLVATSLAAGVQLVNFTTGVTEGSNYHFARRVITLKA